jgi:hypothetical protein
MVATARNASLTAQSAALELQPQFTNDRYETQV